MKESESEFVRHVPCGVCGSSDANSLYTDGHTYCFRCGTHKNGEENVEETPAPAKDVRFRTGEIRALKKRGISEATVQKFGYAIGKDRGKTVQIAPYYNAEGRLVAQKIRTPDKDFYVVGDIREALPFGSQAWQKTGKRIVVTEGEIDAMSVSQVLGNKWPVVSIGGGAGPQMRRQMAHYRDYLLGFDEVVLMFDMDEPGRKAAQVAAEVLGPKAKIAELPHPFKDANEMVQAGRFEELVNAVYRAKQYRPEGIVEFRDLLDAAKERPPVGLSWPFPRLTALTYGIRTGEARVWGAGTGIGKSTLFSQVIAHLNQEHGVDVGVFSLEQATRETALRIAGCVVKKPFYVPDAGWTEDDIDAAWEKINARGRIHLYDSFGANEWDSIKDKIEYLHHAEGVRYFFLDHLTALAAAEEDERKALEMIMADIGSLVKRLDISMDIISHLATPDGTPHEEGGRVFIRHLKGSRAIGFWASGIFGLERNQQSEDERERMTTTLRVLKDRYTGRATGEVLYLGFDPDTGLLYETTAPDEQSKLAAVFEKSEKGEPNNDF